MQGGGYQKCSGTPETKCDEQYKEECEPVTKKECKTVKYDCKTVSEKECKKVGHLRWFQLDGLRLWQGLVIAAVGSAGRVSRLQRCTI